MCHVSFVIHPKSHITCHMSHVTRHTSHVTRHTSHVTRQVSHVTCHMSHVKCHMWHVTCDMWHVTCDAWHVRGGWTFCQNVSFLALMVWEWRYFEDISTKDPTCFWEEALMMIDEPPRSSGAPLRVITRGDILHIAPNSPHLPKPWRFVAIFMLEYGMWRTPRLRPSSHTWN